MFTCYFSLQRILDTPSREAKYFKFFWLPSENGSNMNLIGATYIRASKFNIITYFMGGLARSNWIDFRPRLTFESTAWVAI